MGIKSKQDLAVVLSQLEGFKVPSWELEQYETPSEIAADWVWQAALKGDIRGKVTADLACGPGIITNYLFDKSLDICGIDFSNNMVLLAKSIRQDIDFYFDNAFHTSFDDNRFSGITAFGLISNYDFNAVNNIFKEANRILKPGGLFLFNYYSGQGNLLRSPSHAFFAPLPLSKIA